MKKIFLTLCLVLFTLLAMAEYALPEQQILLFGQSEKVYALAQDNKEIRGLAFDDSSKNMPRLYYLSPPKRKPAAVDYDRKHYDANPSI